MSDNQTPFMTPASMETHHATCHCGHVRFSFPYPPLTATAINKCNCSICTKNGYLLVYPCAKDVVFSRGGGAGELAEYRFGNMNKPHKFCRRCGTSILIDFSESPFERERDHVAINIRTIRGVEDVLDRLENRAVDGKNKLGPPYSV